MEELVVNFWGCGRMKEAFFQEIWIIKVLKNRQLGGGCSRMAVQTASGS